MVVDSNLKRSRSSSLATATAPQRMPLGPGRGVSVNGSRLPTSVSATTVRAAKPSVASKPQQRISVHRDENVDVKDDEGYVEIVDERPSVREDVPKEEEEEAEVAVDVKPEPELDAEAEYYHEKPVRYWPEVATDKATKFKREIEGIREHFPAVDEDDDPTMVSEYADEIFNYMTDLEVSTSPILFISVLTVS